MNKKITESQLVEFKNGKIYLTKNSDSANNINQSRVIYSDSTILQEDVNPNDYDFIIVAFSGGKDSLACILHLFDLNVPKEKIELWHHKIDGGDSNHFMDWVCTESYVRAIAKAFDLKLYYSWRLEGFEGELIKTNAKSHNIQFETPNGLGEYQVVKAKITTRQKFPLLHATDLNKRWCSSLLKIDVGRIAISHQERFLNKKLLFISGERAEESLSRAQYQVFEVHKMDNRNGKYRKRIVDAWRPVHQWTSEQVWDIIERYKINSHPCYRLGWGRCSCSCCIFSSPNQIATLRKIYPECFEKVLKYEQLFDRPIHFKKKRNQLTQIFLDQFMGDAKPFSNLDMGIVREIQNEHWNEPVYLTKWINPSGRYGDNAGSP